MCGCGGPFLSVNDREPCAPSAFGSCATSSCRSGRKRLISPGCCRVIASSDDHRRAARGRARVLETAAEQAPASALNLNLRDGEVGLRSYPVVVAARRRLDLVVPLPPERRERALVAVAGPADPPASAASSSVIRRVVSERGPGPT